MLVAYEIIIFNFQMRVVYIDICVMLLLDELVSKQRTPFGEKLNSYFESHMII